MPTKTGNGGYGQENYDPNTGKYTKTGKWNSLSNESDIDKIIKTMDEELLDIYNNLSDNEKELFLKDYIKEYSLENEKFEEEVGFSINDLETALKQGKIDEELLEIYNKLNDEEKKEFINDLYKTFIEDSTFDTMNRRFDKVSYNEYIQWYTDCLNVLKQKGITQHDLNAFYAEYMGAGSDSFEFNKALRMGFAEYYKKNPRMQNSISNNREAIIDRAERMDKLTRNYEIPRDCSVYRYVDENYLVSQFKKFGVFDDFDIYEHPQYQYETFDKNKYSIQQIYDCLSNLIGGRIDGDGGFTSFSLVEGQTHMGDINRISPDRFKIVHIKYDVPKGTKCFVSNYKKESEGLFPRETKFFIKDVKIEKDFTGKERIALYYGVRQDF